jgi:antitoxin component of MazEF toxin-antitoxin module
VALPQAYVNSYIDDLSFPAVLRLSRPSQPEKNWIVSWKGDVTKRASEIEVPASLAEALQLHQGDQVSFQIVKGCPEATLVYLEAASKDDYDVVETEAEVLTKSILQQMKAVRQGDVIPIWIRGKTFVHVTVLTTKPDHEVLLTNDTIVSVKPPDAASMRDTGSDTSKAEQLARDGKGRSEKIASAGNGLHSDKPRRLTGPLRLRVQVWCHHTAYF